MLYIYNYVIIICIDYNGWKSSRCEKVWLTFNNDLSKIDFTHEKWLDLSIVYGKKHNQVIFIATSTADQVQTIYVFWIFFFILNFMGYLKGILLIYIEKRYNVLPLKSEFYIFCFLLFHILGYLRIYT